MVINNQSKPKFSIVIANYNGRRFLEKCLDSIQNSRLKPERIIVVDDASTDNSGAIVKEKFPNVILIENKNNLGPTKSRNIGAQQAIGKYIIFLDNDLTVQADTFENLISFMENNSAAGICGAKLMPNGKGKMRWNMGYDPNNFRESIGHLFGFLLKIFPNSKILKKMSMFFILNYWDYNQVILVDWVAEGGFIIRKNIFDQLNGFDERFFMFFEGPDLCKRVRKIGYKVYFNPSAKINLFDGHTHNDQKRSAWFAQSKYKFYQKHYFYLKSNPLIFWLSNKISQVLFKIT